MQVLLLFGIYSADAFEGELHLTYPGITKQKSETQHEFRFCFLCFCYQNFFFLHSHKLRMTKSTLTPMTAG